jgi:hypothetical protein
MKSRKREKPTMNIISHRTPPAAPAPNEGHLREGAVLMKVDAAAAAMGRPELVLAVY